MNTTLLEEAAKSVRTKRTAKDKRLWSLYGITEAQWDAMLARQGGHCAVCPATPGTHQRGMHTDHDHGTGVFRGILCANCNLMLGNAKESPERLESGAEYLRVHGR